jgi:vitamin B12 transporter
VAQALAGETISVELTGFANRFDDLIVAVGPSMRNASRFVTDNIANARTRGVELGLETRLRSGLDVRLAYTLLDSAVLALDRLPAQAPSPFAVGQPLVRRARHRGSLDVVLSRPRLTAFAAIGARGRMLDVEPSFGASAGLFSAAGYFVASGGLTYRIGRVVEIYGRVGNIFDRSYEEVYGFPAMGRNGMLGVRIAARK